MTATERSPLPPLVVQHPLCPICDKEVSYEGGSYRCETCHGSWASHRYDEKGVAAPDTEQCPAEVAPDEDGEYPSRVGRRYRCVRDVGHPADWPDRHIGVPADGDGDHSGDPFEWRDGEYPQWRPAEEAAADASATAGDRAHRPPLVEADAYNVE